MFADREDGARLLAKEFNGLTLRDPLVLAIPRGGVVTGAVLAKELGAELDIVLSRKLRAPYQSEFAIGAVGEDGEVYLNHHAASVAGANQKYIDQERDYQLEEIAQRHKLFREVRPQAAIKGRTVILTDDGIATGSTMIAALHVISTQAPHEVIVAVPVAPPDLLEIIRGLCDHLICLFSPEDFAAVGQFYRDFRRVEDKEIVQMLGQSAGSQERSRSKQCALLDF